MSTLGLGTGPHTLHIIASRQPGGAEYFFSRLVNAMHSATHPTEALVSSRCGYADRLDPAVRLHRLPMKGIWDLYSRYAINRIVKQQQIDIVQTYLGRAARLTRLNRTGVRLVCRIGGYYNPRQYAHADHWVCNTRGLCDYMVRSGMPADRVHMIPNFVTAPTPLSVKEKSCLRQQYGVAADDILLCSVGRLHSIKGLDTLISAFALLRKRYSQQQCKLLLAGEGPEREALMQLAQSLQVADRIIWAGWQSNTAPLYQIADIVVCSSIQEGFGNVILEAWANGTAVLSTAAEGPVELIDSGESGILVPIGAPEAMADALCQLIDTPAMRDELAYQGAIQLETHYSEDAIVKQYADLYRDII